MLAATITTVVFIIVFLIVVAFLLKEIFAKPKVVVPDAADNILYQSGDFFNRKESIMKGGADSLPEDILKLVKVRWPQVSVLSNAILQKVPLESFFYSEKTDGEHKNLLIYNRNIYDVTHSDDIKVIGEVTTDKTLILDTELYENIYYIFDVVYADEDVSEFKFLDRMKKVNVDELGDKF